MWGYSVGVGVGGGLWGGGEGEDGRVVWEGDAAFYEVGEQQAAGDFGVEDGQGDEVAFLADEGFCDTADGAAAGDGARDLGDDEGGEAGLGVAGPVEHEVAGFVLWGGEAEVGDEVATDHVGIEAIQKHTREIGAIVKEEVEVSDVAAVVEEIDKAGVLGGGGEEGEADDAAVVGGADELDPLAGGGGAEAGVRGDGEEVLAAVLVAKEGDGGGGGGEGDLGGVVHGVEVGDEGDGDPVVAIDFMVAGDDDAELAGAAGAEVGGGGGADVIEVEGGVAGGVHGAKLAEGLLHEEGDGGVGCRGGYGEEDESEESSTMDEMGFDAVLPVAAEFRGRRIDVLEADGPPDRI